MCDPVQPNRFWQFSAWTLALVLAFVMPVTARASNCPELPYLGVIVQVEPVAFRTGQEPQNHVLRALDRMLRQLKHADIKENLQKAGHPGAYSDASIFVSDVVMYTVAGLQKGPKAAHDYAQKRSFRDRLERMREVVLHVCPELADAPPNPFGDDEPHSQHSHDESTLLHSQSEGEVTVGNTATVVFGLLGAVMILGLGYVLYIFTALLLSARRRCAIPAWLQVGVAEIEGELVVLGRTGAAFQPLTPPSRREERMVKKGLRCKVICDGIEIEGRTSRPLAQSVGMNFLPAIDRKTFHACLSQSTIPPRRCLFGGERMAGSDPSMASADPAPSS